MGHTCRAPERAPAPLAPMLVQLHPALPPMRYVAGWWTEGGRCFHAVLEGPPNVR